MEFVAKAIALGVGIAAGCLSVVIVIMQMVEIISQV